MVRSGSYDMMNANRRVGKSAISESVSGAGQTSEQILDQALHNALCRLGCQLLVMAEQPPALEAERDMQRFDTIMILPRHIGQMNVDKRTLHFVEADIVGHEKSRLIAFEVGRDAKRQDCLEYLGPTRGQFKDSVLPAVGSKGTGEDGQNAPFNHLRHLAVERVHVVKMTEYSAQAYPGMISHTGCAG